MPTQRRQKNAAPGRFNIRTRKLSRASGGAQQELAPPGSSHPLGATVTPSGTNFSLYTRSASRVQLVLFDRVDDQRPSRTIDLDQARNRTYHYWHTTVPGLKAGQLYGYRAVRTRARPSF
jgi:pullulanase/glycogen debranching enzyme